MPSLIKVHFLLMNFFDSNNGNKFKLCSIAFGPQFIYNFFFKLLTAVNLLIYVFRSYSATCTTQEQNT